MAEEGHVVVCEANDRMLEASGGGGTCWRGMSVADSMVNRLNADLCHTALIPKRQQGSTLIPR